MIYNVDCLVRDGSLRVVTFQVPITGRLGMDVEDEINDRVPRMYTPLVWEIKN